MRRTPRADRKDGWTIDELPSGRFRLRAWDQVLRKYKSSTHASREAAEGAGKVTVARFTLGQDSAEQVTLERVWKAYAGECYGIEASEADDLAAKDRVELAARALGSRMRANWRTVYAMARVVQMMRMAGAVDFKDKAFRSRILAMFNGMALARTKSQDDQVAVSTKERIKGQVRALVNFAVKAGWLNTSPIDSLKVTNARQQSDTTREVFTLTELRSLLQLDRVADPIWIHAALMLYAGLRDSEARALTWLDYEPQRRLLWVRKAKGGKSRTIPVQPELGEILARVSDAIGPTAQVPAIPSLPIARPTPGRSLARYANWTALLTDAGVQVSRGIDPITNMRRTLCRHSCRHTFAAVMLACGEDGDSLRIAMGHSGDSDLTALYASQSATFRAEVERERWERGHMAILKPTTSKRAAP